MKTRTAHDVFQYLRGAIRSAYGIENFRQRSFVILGMCEESQSLLSLLCFDGVDVKFIDDLSTMSSYQKAFTICNSVDVASRDEGLCFDVLVDFSEGVGYVKGQEFRVNGIGENPYEKGIHDYYIR